jgi:uncharacterized protein
LKSPARVGSSRGPWRRWWPIVITLIAITFPFLLLIPLGGVWLWQQGALRWWLLLAAVLGAGGYAIAAWLRRRVERTERLLAEHDREAPVSPPNPDWSPRDLAAWDKVQRLAGAADRHIVGDRDLLLAAARETIELVAVEYHPDPGKAVWRFTLPEALLLCERLSARLRVVLLDNVPGVHLVRVGQAREIWALKPAAERGMRIFGHVAKVYRTVRLINPLGALLAEARDWLVTAALGETGDYLRRRGARIWIEEVGRAAIELYSGRLRVDAGALGRYAEGAPDLGVAAAELPGPLRLVVAGQINAGKSSLVNALLGEVRAAADVLPLTTDFTRYRLERDGLPEAEIVDAPGLERRTMARITALACEADCLVWVVAAHRPDRAMDRAALDAVRAEFAARPERRMPPVIAVMSHIDRLSPAREWAPPYDISVPQGPKATAIRAALEAVSIDLAMPAADIVPARLQPLEHAYNIELIWASLAARFEAAQYGRVLRLLRSAPRHELKQVLKQAGGAGRILLGKSGPIR